jgi:hypothetical protein
MDELTPKIVSAATKVVEASAERDGRILEFSEASLAIVEEMVAEAAAFFAQTAPDQRENTTQNFGCYVLEVGRREFGGRYAWFDQRDQPVLVVGEPDFRVALMAWDKVRGRLAADPADDIPFFYAGFAERVRKAQPGTYALYV